jgi:hypothetical protein
MPTYQIEYYTDEEINMYPIRVMCLKHQVYDYLENRVHTHNTACGLNYSVLVIRPNVMEATEAGINILREIIKEENNVAL